MNLGPSYFNNSIVHLIFIIMIFDLLMCVLCFFLTISFQLKIKKPANGLGEQ